MKTKAEKIKEIDTIVTDYGSFTPSEINAGNPVINVIGKHSVIVERINAGDVDTCEYIEGVEVREGTLAYEELTNDLVDEIYELVLQYQVDCEKAIKRATN